MSDRGNVLTEDALGAVIRSSGDQLLLPDRYVVEAERLFQAGRARSMTVSAVLWTIFCALLIAVTVVLISSGGSVGTIAEVPIPAILVAGSFGIFVILLWLIPILYRRIGRLASRFGIRLFVIGASPFSRQFIAVTNSSITLFDHSGRVIGNWPSREVVVTALKQFGPAVSLVVATKDTFSEVPIALQIGGPTAPFWSSGGVLGRHALHNALQNELRESGYSLASV